MGSRYVLLLKATTISFCCNWASDGVPVTASKRFTALTPDCARSAVRRVFGCAPESAYTIMMRKLVGPPHVGVAVTVGESVAVDVRVAVGGVPVFVGVLEAQPEGGRES